MPTINDLKQPTPFVRQAASTNATFSLSRGLAGKESADSKDILRRVSDDYLGSYTASPSAKTSTSIPTAEQRAYVAERGYVMTRWDLSELVAGGPFIGAPGLFTRDGRVSSNERAVMDLLTSVRAQRSPVYEQGNPIQRLAEAVLDVAADGAITDADVEDIRTMVVRINADALAKDPQGMQMLDAFDVFTPGTAIPLLTTPAIDGPARKPSVREATLALGIAKPDSAARPQLSGLPPVTVTNVPPMSNNFANITLTNFQPTVWEAPPGGIAKVVNTPPSDWNIGPALTPNVSTDEQGRRVFTFAPDKRGWSAQIVEGQDGYVELTSHLGIMRVANNGDVMTKMRRPPDRSLPDQWVDYGQVGEDFRLETFYLHSEVGEVSPQFHFEHGPDGKRFLSSVQFSHGAAGLSTVQVNGIVNFNNAGTETRGTMQMQRLTDEARVDFSEIRGDYMAQQHLLGRQLDRAPASYSFGLYGFQKIANARPPSLPVASPCTPGASSAASASSAGLPTSQVGRVDVKLASLFDKQFVALCDRLSEQRARIAGANSSGTVQHSSAAGSVGDTLLQEQLVNQMRYALQLVQFLFAALAQRFARM